MDINISTTTGSILILLLLIQLPWCAPPPLRISTIFVAEAGQRQQHLQVMLPDQTVANIGALAGLVGWLYRASNITMVSGKTYRYSSNDADNRSVLVPGAGLGRLA
jgi:hypothetical protein